MKKAAYFCPASIVHAPLQQFQLSESGSNKFPISNHGFKLLANLTSAIAPTH
ncbi:MAG: hypothetical protein QNJ51_09405 [Calothrix sp. MO_167.B12]|nr:hypothetical protein [Calothrix sp. MO_167.B12]